MNPQPTVLETVALPVELLAYVLNIKQKMPSIAWHSPIKNYLIILDTTPAPTVLPPSRMANFKPSSIAIGAINETFILILSPGITISTLSGSSHAPVTSVVLK